MPPGCQFSGSYRTQASPRLGLHLIDRYRWNPLAPLLSVAAMLLAVACHDAGGPVPSAIHGPPNFSLGGPGVWTTKAPMPTARYNLASGVVNGILYAVGGGRSNASIVATVEAYDPVTNTWTTKAAMPTPRNMLGVGVVNGILYAVGGYWGGPLATVQAYDPATNTWTNKASMPAARYALAVGVVNGILYAVGGVYGNSAMADVWAYDPVTNMWTSKAAMPTARYGHAVGVVNGILYAVGGCSGSGFCGVGPLTTVEAYDPATNTWTTKASMPTARDGLAGGVVNGILYAVGGYSEGFDLATVEAYDPTTNTWTTKASMPTARQKLAVDVVNGVLYAVGGHHVSELPTVEAYQPAATNHFVSPTGTSGGDGSISNPWDLQTALDGAGGRILAGDTVWLRGGTYAGHYRTTLKGAPHTPVIFRRYRPEWARIDGTLRIDSADVVVWGFEVFRSTLTGDTAGVETNGPRTKLINMIIHDAAEDGISFWNGAADAEVYGNVVYNNGTHDNLDHGVYLHNHAGTKTLEDNVFFQNLGLGIHAYASPGNQPQVGIRVLGNVAFNNGTISTAYASKVNILVGGDVVYSGIQVIDNMAYHYEDAASVRIGFDTAITNGDVVIRRNYIRRGGANNFAALRIHRWQQATVDSNTLAATIRDVLSHHGSLAGYTWGSNKYYRSPTAKAWMYNNIDLTFQAWKDSTNLGAQDTATATNPTAARVFVRPNRYEAGRGFVVIFNWPGTSSPVPVDLSSILAVGQTYEVRNVQQLICPPGLCAPILSGTYSGGTVSFPMTGVPAPAPNPLGNRRVPPFTTTAPHFDVFLVARPGN